MLLGQRYPHGYCAFFLPICSHRRWSRAAIKRDENSGNGPRDKKCHRSLLYILSVPFFWSHFLPVPLTIIASISFLLYRFSFLLPGTDDSRVSHTFTAHICFTHNFQNMCLSKAFMKMLNHQKKNHFAWTTIHA